MACRLNRTLASRTTGWEAASMPSDMRHATTPGTRGILPHRIVCTGWNQSTEFQKAAQPSYPAAPLLIPHSLTDTGDITAANTSSHVHRSTATVRGERPGKARRKDRRFSLSYLIWRFKMSAIHNTTLPARSNRPNRIILASAFRREKHSAGRQERAGKNLRRMSRSHDSFEKSGGRRLIETADDLLDE